MADCGITALTSALKIFFFATLPFMSLCLTLGSFFLDCLPNEKLVPIGVVALVVYQLAFLLAFGQFLSKLQRKEKSDQGR